MESEQTRDEQQDQQNREINAQTLNHVKATCQIVTETTQM